MSLRQEKTAKLYSHLLNRALDCLWNHIIDKNLSCTRCSIRWGAMCEGAQCCDWYDGDKDFVCLHTFCFFFSFCFFLFCELREKEKTRELTFAIIITSESLSSSSSIIMRTFKNTWEHPNASYWALIRFLLFFFGLAFISLIALVVGNLNEISYYYVNEVWQQSFLQKTSFNSSLMLAKPLK